MFTETEALVIIKFIHKQREEVQKSLPEAGPAQVAYFTIVRMATHLAIDSGLTINDVLKEIAPQPTELIL